MKATLEFLLPEDNDAFRDAQNATTYRLALEAIWNEVFRPRHKHGYGDTALQALIETDEGAAVADKLEQIYRDVLGDYELNI